MIVYAHQGDTLDAICWRYLGQTQGVVEQTLLLNPGLTEQGPILEQGTAVTLPDRPVARVNTLKTVKLWD